MVNTSFLITSYIVCMFIDWVFQWNWQAIHKSKWGKADDKFLSFIAVFSHSIVYAGLSGAVLYFLLGNSFNLPLTIIFLLVSHVIIDTRIPVKLIMRFKRISKEDINDFTNFGFMHIGIDHRLHELILLILAIIV